MSSQLSSTSFFQRWVNALTKPSEQTFAEMAASPNAKATTGYIEVFVGYVVYFLFLTIVQGVRMRGLMSQYGLGNGAGRGFGGELITVICGAPIGAVIATLFFAIGTAIVQWVAKMFGGKGTNGQLVYALGAIFAPYFLVASVFTLLAAIPFVGLCFSALLGIFGLYVLVLEIMAVKGVNQFGWGAAIGSLFLPALVVGLVCGCLVAIAVFALGPVVGNVFSSINQSLGGG